MSPKGKRPKCRIDEEEVCKDCFEHHLRHVCGCCDVTVTREKNDPPDYWAQISGKSFAVEVTSIVNDQARMAGYKALAHKLETLARLNRLLKGSYALGFVREPIFPRHGSRDWNDLVAATMLYLRQTATLAQADEAILVNNHEGKLSLCKIALNPDCLVFGGGVTTPQFADEAQAELSSLLQKAITGKRERLEKKRVPEVCGDAILLLYDAYGFGDVPDVKTAFRTVNGLDWFHSVFWVYPVWRTQVAQAAPRSPLRRLRDGCFLHTRETAWLRHERQFDVDALPSEVVEKQQTNESDRS